MSNVDKEIDGLVEQDLYGTDGLKEIEQREIQIRSMALEILRLQNELNRKPSANFDVIFKECSMWFDDSTDYAHEMATEIYNKLKESESNA